MDPREQEPVFWNNISESIVLIDYVKWILNQAFLHMCVFPELWEPGAGESQFQAVFGQLYYFMTSCNKLK